MLNQKPAAAAEKSLSRSANRNKPRLILVLQLVATGDFRSIIFRFDQHTRQPNYPGIERNEPTLERLRKRCRTYPVHTSNAENS